ncbi:hypothetical protein [Scatolibacter rhodanostii]|uniref:hypothetical protein n=1 Tax=Scatolibacter rhodanostii TaxID=2014781 RepID=UPI000C06B092|nr:hypothetical protein [Scatolibacter rhodanostii]
MKKKQILSVALTAIVFLSACSSGKVSEVSEKPTEASGKETSATETAAENDKKTAEIEIKLPALGGDLQKGSYVGENITPEDVGSINTLSRLSDGHLVMYNWSLTEKYESTDDGDTWKKSEGPGKKLIDEGDKESITGPTVDTDGTTYAIQSSKGARGESEIQDKIIKIAPTGENSELKINEIEEVISQDKAIAILEASVVAHQKLYVEYIAGIEYQEYDQGDGQISYSQVEGVGEYIYAVYDTQTGEKVYDVAPELNHPYQNATKDETGIYVFNANDDDNIEIAKIDSQNGEEISRVTTDKSFGGRYSGDWFSLSPEGVMYNTNYTGIYQIDLESGETTLIADNSKLVLGDTDSYPSNFLALEDKVFLAIVNNNGSEELWRFSYDPNFAYDPNLKLTIWTLEENSALRTTAAQFLQTYPQFNISIEVGAATYGFQDQKMLFAEDIDEMLKEFNTRVLAGEAPDVFLIDGFPMTRYADEGLLLNLEGKVDTSEFFGTLAEQMKREKGTFYLPTSLSIPVLSMSNYKGEDFSSYDEWISFLEASSAENPFIEDSDLQNIYTALWQSAETGIIQDSGINEENLQKFMKAFRAIAEKNKLTGTLAAENSQVAMNGRDPYEWFIYGSPSAGIEFRHNSQLNKDMAQLSQMGSLQDFDTPAHYPQEEKYNLYPNEKIMLAPSIDEGVWIPYDMLAISATSDQQELATAFLQFALSPSIQAGGDTWSSFPMVEPALDIMVANAKKSYEKNKADYPEGFPEGDPEPTFGYEKDIAGFMAQLKTPLISEGIVSRQMWDSIITYIKDEATLEEACTQAKDTAKIYVGERTR